MTEAWKPIPGYPGYEASDHGRVRSIDRRTWSEARGQWINWKGRALRANQRSGYFLVYPSRDGKISSIFVHTAVLLAFVGPRPDGWECCHYDDNKHNNNLTNLRWDTVSENKRDLIRNGRHPEARKTHCKWGHEFTPENTINRGYRQCRMCANRWGAEKRARMRLGAGR